jgi:hypothetical protein
MILRFSLVLLLGIASSACLLRKPTPSVSPPRGGADKSSDSRQSANDDKGSGSGLTAAAVKITDACVLMPADLVKKIVPNANEPSREQYPRRCNVSNGTSVLEITIETGIATPVDPINGAEFIPELAEGGYLERLDPYAKGDIYLTVILGKDPPGILHVEVAGHDGKDHKDDAIDVAREILQHLKS